MTQGPQTLLIVASLLLLFNRLPVCRGQMQDPVIEVEIDGPPGRNAETAIMNMLANQGAPIGFMSPAGGKPSSGHREREKLLDQLLGSGGGGGASGSAPAALFGSKDKEQTLDKLLSGGARPGDVMDMGSNSMSPFMMRRHSREDELDRMLQSMLGSMVEAGPGRMQQQMMGPDPMLQGLLQSLGGPGRSGQVIIDGSGPGGFSGEIVLDGPPGGVPPELFRDLFPGPMLVESAGPPRRHMPFPAPDPMIADLLRATDAAFHDAMVGKLPSRSNSGDHLSCLDDIKKHCASANSHLHCLGQHREDISQPCRKDVGKSLPFLCSSAIDRFCNVLQNGLLQCLGSKLDTLEGSCRDAVLATREVLTAAKAPTPAPAQPPVSSGITRAKPAAPTKAPAALLQAAVASPVQKEARLDARLAGGGAAVKPTLFDEAAQQLDVQHGGSGGSGSILWHALRFVASAALLVLVLYFFLFTDCPRHSFARMKPYMGMGAPLRSGVEMPKQLLQM